MSAPASILIDGRWVPARSAETRTISNPTTVERIGLVPECGTDDVTAAVEAAARAEPAWWKVPGVERKLPAD